jgi:hypothetical protein
MVRWNILCFVGKGGKNPNSKSAMERMKKTLVTQSRRITNYTLTVREISLRGGDRVIKLPAQRQWLLTQRMRKHEARSFFLIILVHAQLQQTILLLLC